jgi:hypothetical protein
MPIPVRAVLWEPRLPGLPLSDHEWEMFELPEADARYWHDKTGYRVDRIEEIDGETRVHLVRDPEWEEQMSQGLPDDHLVDGGRSSDTGEWHFRVVGPRGAITGWHFDNVMEPPIQTAVAVAVRALDR